MAAAFLLVPALPASAHIDFFVINDVERDENDPGEWSYNSVEGEIECSTGERFLVTAKVTDDDFIGKGRTKGTCIGDGQQSWDVDLDQSGSGFGDGCWERVRAKAHTKINGVPHDEAVYTFPPNCA